MSLMQSTSMKPEASRRSTHLAAGFYAVTLLAAVLLLSSCAGTTSIKQLLDDPSHHDGQVVRIAGEVTETIGAAGMGAYRVDDGTGTMTVVSKEGGAPRKGAHVGVEGKFHSAFTLGPQTLAVVEETRRETR